MDGELGVIEQRMPEIEKAKTGNQYDNIRALLDRDPDNLWHVVLIDFGVNSYFILTILGFYVSKEFNEPVKEYVLTFGEDGKWEDVYQIDNPSEPKDGTMFGDLNIGDIQ
jgi:hypothetical protein